MLLYRLRQQLTVKVKADGADMTALPGAKQRPGSPYLQVFHGDVKTGPQFSGFKDSPQAFLRGWGQAFLPVIEKIGVGKLGAAAYPPAKLV